MAWPIVDLILTKYGHNWGHGMTYNWINIDKL